MAEENTPKPDIPSCPGSLYPPVSQSDSERLGRDHGYCKTCNQLIGLVPSTSPHFRGLVVDDHPRGVGGFTDSEGPHDMLEEAQAIVVPQIPKQIPGSTQPESAEKLKKEVQRREEWVSNYCKPLRKAVDALKEQDFYVNFDLIKYCKPQDEDPKSKVSCIVDSCEVTDFASFIQNVFYIGVRPRKEPLGKTFFTNSQKPTAGVAKKMVERFEKIWEGKGKVKEVCLDLDTKFSASDKRVLMVDSYGEKNLSQIKHDNPQLLNVKKLGLSQDISEPLKSKCGVYFLYQAWKLYDQQKSVIEIQRPSLDPADVDDLERAMRTLSSQPMSSPK